jgi:drug/metabolite transporter (DMT)-like permease
MTFAVQRFWLGAICLIAVLYASGRRLDLNQVRRSMPGGIALGIATTLWFCALKDTGVVDASMIAALLPALVMLLARPMFGERLHPSTIVAVALAIGGAMLVAAGSSSLSVWSLRGDLLAAASLVASAGYFLLSKRARETVPTLEYTAVAFLGASLVVTLMALAYGQPLLQGLSGTNLAIMIGFVIGATGAHVLLSWAHASVDVSVSSLLTLGSPIPAGIFALMFLHEHVGLLSALGGLVVLVPLGFITSRLPKGARS